MAALELCSVATRFWEANIFGADDELSGLNCFTRGVGRAPSQEWGEEMRRLRVSVQAGLTPDGLGPRPDCSSAGWRIDGLHSSCTHAFSNVTHSSRVQGTDGNRRVRDREFTHFCAQSPDAQWHLQNSATLEWCIKQNNSSNAAFIWWGHKWGGNVLFVKV